ncbi:winged helix-turn-helix domain-containing protein [Natrinema halophilum]|uniref:Helix-turn-helix transcriptional regulator n=1 Tax=Natrinema halophilum TaxID=1699371 RepID=A0A7D5KFQ5_9EURY|nr:helix-turn-helix domain-containing protein [Natrinema halophilum]QLG51021.1 helix-turn-helix domain-containing protein [Natrinema halophilum]
MAPPNPDARETRTRGWQHTEQVDPQAVLTALDDAACRSILEATNEESLTATELSERCDIPMSTAYRKVELLTEADLVEEQVRINTSGKHATEYHKSFDDVLVSVTGGEIEIEMTKPKSKSKSASSAAIASD